MPENFQPLDAARFDAAIRRFDEENARDPNVETVNGSPQPRERVYARWLTDWVLKLWDSYPRTRAGYLQWREALKRFHAQKAAEILREAGYPEDTIRRVQELNLKKNFPHDAEGRVLEDALCLVFLERQLTDLASRTSDEKVINALQKSWQKMTPAAHAEALKLPFGPREKVLVDRALAT